MSRHVLLTPEHHQSVRISQERSASNGDALMYSLTFPAEFRSVQACYPILFQRDEKNMRYFPVALFGFEQNENLFLNDGQWDAEYIPMMVEKDPFFIGLQEAEDGGERKRVVTMDEDSPRVNQAHGEALFDGSGAYTPYLSRLIDILETVHEGYQHCEIFIDALMEHDLIEPITMQINLSDGSSNQLHGFFTINEEKLQNLSGEVLETFSQRGFLAPIFMAVASMARMSELIKRKQSVMSSSLADDNPLFNV